MSDLMSSKAECVVCGRVGKGQCSKCHTVWYCSVECQKSHWAGHKQNCSKSVQQQPVQQGLMEEKDLDRLTLLVRQYVNVYKIIYVLDPVEADRFKERNQHHFLRSHQLKGHSQGHHSQSKCCSVSLSHIYSPLEEQSCYERQLGELLARASLKGGVLAELLNSCGKNFFNIKHKGIQDKLTWDQGNQKYLMAKVMEEGCQVFFVNKLKSLLRQKQKVDSQQPMLYANASTWKAKYPDVQLDFLEMGFTKSLCQRGFAVQKRYAGDINELVKQCDWIERDGRMEESTMESNMRNDRHIWVTSASDVEYPEISKIIKQMSALQFQINTKTALSCSISQMWMLSYFKSNGSHKKHTDSGLQQDTGKKFSVILCLQKTQVTLYDREDTKTLVSLEAKDLLVIKSRFYSYEVQCPENRTFMLRYWINGPRQPQA